MAWDGGGRPGHGRQEKNVSSKKEKRRTGASVSKPSPGHRAEDRQETQRSRRRAGVAGAHDHPPLLADEQEEKRDQARDECQADPDDGPGVVAGPCRGEPGRVGDSGGGDAASQPWPQAHGSGGPPRPGGQP